MRSEGLLRPRAAAAAIGAFVWLFLTPALGVAAASHPQSTPPSTSVMGGVTRAIATDPKSICKPDKNGDVNNNDNDKTKCPPPVVPEAPLALLLPLSAGVIVAGTYVVMRVRAGNRAPA